jgi:hypothetical protein
VLRCFGLRRRLRALGRSGRALFRGRRAFDLRDRTLGLRGLTLVSGARVFGRGGYAFRFRPSGVSTSLEGLGFSFLCFALLAATPALPVSEFFVCFMFLALKAL